MAAFVSLSYGTNTICTGKSINEISFCQFLIMNIVIALIAYKIWILRARLTKASGIATSVYGDRAVLWLVIMIESAAAYFAIMTLYLALSLSGSIDGMIVGALVSRFLFMSFVIC
jgi:hypothetical protein